MVSVEPLGTELEITLKVGGVFISWQFPIGQLIKLRLNFHY
jgi:hypothetical protein